jgi:hypothetical protein
MNKPAGRWPIAVNCGRSGQLQTKIAVMAAEPEMPLSDATRAKHPGAPLAEARIARSCPRKLRAVPSTPTSNAATASADSSANTVWRREAEFAHPTGSIPTGIVVRDYVLVYPLSTLAAAAAFARSSPAAITAASSSVIAATNVSRSTRE